MKTLVYDDGIYKVFWNHSATFNIYTRGLTSGEVLELDVFTVYGCDLLSAIEKAHDYMEDY